MCSYMSWSVVLSFLQEMNAMKNVLLNDFLLLYEAAQVSSIWKQYKDITTFWVLEIYALEV